MNRIDINCDIGESFGAYKIGMDEAVMPYITSANVACGWHAGDPSVMNRTVRLAAERGVRVGAHPGYPDMQGFGRRFLECSPDEIRDFAIYQIGALQAFCAVHVIQLSHVKPHGALYNAAVRYEKVGAAIAEGIASVDPNLLYFTLAGKAGDNMARIGKEAGLRVIREAFPDGNYTAEGTLVPRSRKNAVVHNPETVAERAIQIATKGALPCEEGSWIELEAQTLCVHGDSPEAVDTARRIRMALEQNGVRVLPIN